MTTNSNPDILFDIQNTGGSPAVPVSVYWAGTDISSITGPTPFVDFSKSVNRDGSSSVETITTSITLTGKIVRVPDVSDGTVTLDPGIKGITGLLASVDRLQNLFTNCSTGSFEIKCNKPTVSTIFSRNGVKFNSISFDKNDDHWVRVVDFTISLEYQEGGNPNDPSEMVTDKSDSWSVEPMEDTVYTKFVTTVNQRSEWSNPNLRPSAASEGSPQPPGTINGPASSQGVASRLQVMSIPQFRITRRLSAKGLKPPTSGSGSGSCISASGSLNKNESYLSAKIWVEKQLALAFNGNASGNGPYLTKTPSLGEFSLTSTWLYNHNRTINIDINNSTYEATDTWVAMPTGMPYTESYSIESSTSQEYIRTVRVAGNIQGLSFTPFPLMDGTSGILPSGSGYSTAVGTGTKYDNPISLRNSLIMSQGGPIPPYELSDVPDTTSILTKLGPSKYENAMSGWLYDIKPYLYRRACLAINNADRPKQYVNPVLENPPKVPQNPIYSKESLLSVIPVSTSEGYDPKKGTINYSYEYNNHFNIISGVISENISITNDAPADAISETQVPGRALGPILQKTGSTAARKTVNIEVTVMPPTSIDGFFVNNIACPVYTGGYIYGIINKLIEGIKPFGNTRHDTSLFGNYANTKNIQGQVFVSSDQDSWTPTQGRYTRTVSWTYQQCTNARAYLDH